MDSKSVEGNLMGIQFPLSTPNLVNTYPFIFNYLRRFRSRLLPPSLRADMPLRYEYSTERIVIILYN